MISREGHIAMDKIENINLQSYEARKKRARRRMITAVLLIGAVAAALGVLYLYGLENRVYNSYEIITSREKTSGAEEYIQYGDGVLRVNRDGAEALDGDGSMLWNVAYTMTDPIYAVCEGAAAVADRAGRSLYIMDGTGSSNPVDTVHPIYEIDVANQGVTAVLTIDGVNTYINLYSISGSNLLEIRTTAGENGFPVDIALSNDGTKLVTSYVMMRDGEMTTQITCYNFGDVGQNYTDNIVALYYYERQFCPKVEFLTNNIFCIFLDNGVEVYRMQETPGDPIFVKAVEQEIQSIFYSESYIGFVLLNEEGSERYRIELYDLEGNTVLTRTTNDSYKYIMVSEEEMIYYDDLNVVIVKLNGMEKFRYRFSTNIDFFLPGASSQRYLMATDSEIITIRLTQQEEETTQ